MIVTINDLLDMSKSVPIGGFASTGSRSQQIRNGVHLPSGTVRLGRGMSFVDSRPYQPGDDIRSIDWRVTARLGRPHTKVFEEERERPLWIVVDRSCSMNFGSRVMFKSVLAARGAAWLAWAGRASADRIGGCLIDPAGPRLLRPIPGDDGVLALLHGLCTPAAESATKTPMAEALETLLMQVKCGDRVYLLSDFYALDDHDSAVPGLLGQLAGRTETGLLHISDPLEIEAPPAATYPVMCEGNAVWLDLADAQTRLAWSATYRRRAELLKAIAARHACRLLGLSTDGQLPAVLGSLL